MCIGFHEPTAQPGSPTSPSAYSAVAPRSLLSSLNRCEVRARPFWFSNREQTRKTPNKKYVRTLGDILKQNPAVYRFSLSHNSCCRFVQKSQSPDLFFLLNFSAEGAWYLGFGSACSPGRCLIEYAFRFAKPAALGELQEHGAFVEFLWYITCLFRAIPRHVVCCDVSRNDCRGKRPTASAMATLATRRGKACGSRDVPQDPGQGPRQAPTTPAGRSSAGRGNSRYKTRGKSRDKSRGQTSCKFRGTPRGKYRWKQGVRWASGGPCGGMIIFLHLVGESSAK